VRTIKYLFALLWLEILMFPVILIVYKLSIYLLETPFKEWHITILWVFITPVTLIIVFMIKDKEKEK